MSSTFISGNRAINQLDPNQFHPDLNRILTQVKKVLVGDADGLDSIIIESSVQSDLPTTVYYSGRVPRNLNKGASYLHVPAIGSVRAWHTHKDVALSVDCSNHVGFVDTSVRKWQCSGTVANHERVKEMGKPSLLYDVATHQILDSTWEV